MDNQVKRDPMAAAPVSGKAIYTCPMHAEVQQDHPGECPKCGMALESKTAVAGADYEDNADLQDMTRRFWVGAALTLPVFLLAMAHMIPALGKQPWVTGDVSRWIQFALTTPVVCWAGWPFFQRGWRSVVTLHLNMFTLIAIGVGAAFLYSAVAMLLPALFPHSIQHEGKVGIYFEAASMVVVLVLLGQIGNMVAEAQRSRAPIQGLADKVAGLFVPAVLTVSVLTFVLWIWIGPEPKLAYAIVHAVAALIIACLCALGLATPMSIMVGVGRGAQEGVLVKHAEALEQLEKVTTLVVDKTGTLTEGKPKLMDILPVEGFDAKDILRLAASLELNSEHPLAAAIVQGAKEQSLTLDDVKDFRSVTAGEVAGTVADRAVMVGKPDFLSSEKITGLEPLEASAVKLQEDGKTAMFIALDGQPVAILAVADPIKASTAEANEELHRPGLESVMLTGDNRLTAAAVVKQLGLDAVEAEIDPAEKLAHVKKLRAEGKHVAMAGDGTNDAPTLSEAEVGIAMGTGTDVAMQSAGITLVKGDLRSIAKGIRLSRATMRNIREKLVFAFLYNALGIPVAAGLLYPFFGLLLSRIIAGAAMSLSSVSVISNDLHLLNVRL